jgi:hypothetical protein
MPLISRARGTRPVLAALSASMLFVLGACGSSDPKPSANTQTSTTSGSTTSSDAEGASTSTTAPSTAGTLVEVTVAGGQVTGGVSRTHIDVGESVTIRVTSDVAEEIHVHGYDLKRDLMPGVPVEVTFTADIPGVFEVELEHSGLKVAELEVA